MAVAEGRELGDEGGVIRIGFIPTGVLNRLEKGAEIVGEAEERGGDGRAGGEFLVAQGIEEVFAGVRDFLDTVKTEAARGAFQRVDDAEDVVERFAVGGAFFQEKDRTVVAIKALETFREHVTDELFLKIGTHAAMEPGSTRPTAARSCCC